MSATDADLREVDRLDVLVLVDNATDNLSTTPKHVVPEWTGLRRAGRLPELSGGAICCAHHGLSLLITTHVGDETHAVLFDAGPEGATLRRNAAILGVDFGEAAAAATVSCIRACSCSAARGSPMARCWHSSGCRTHPGSRMPARTSW